MILGLSLFPGIGLLDRGFEEEWPDLSIVRGPDKLWGGDIHTFHPPAGVFDGVWGGPPCQSFSTAGQILGSGKLDLIPEFIRVVRESDPEWVVMENVPGAIGHPSIPEDWFCVVLRDWDCGGLTNRRRAIWSWPYPIPQPSHRTGSPSQSVLASTARKGSGQYVKDKGFLPGNLPIMEYARLQGSEDVGRELVDHRAGREFSVTVLGNGVPRAMARYVARYIRSGSMKELMSA